MTKVTGTELLRQLCAEADLGRGHRRLRQAIDVVTDPTAAEAEVEAVRAADARIAVDTAERDTAVGKARADASQRANAAEADRDQVLTRAAQAEQAAQLAQQEAARAQAAADTARAKVARVRADSEKMLAGFRAEALTTAMTAHRPAGSAPLPPATLASPPPGRLCVPGTPVSRNRTSVASGRAGVTTANEKGGFDR